MDERTLHKDLSAQFSGRPLGRAIELSQRRVRVPALQQHQNQAQARLERANIQPPGLGDGNRATQAASRSAQSAGLASREADGAIGHRRCLRLDTTIREHRQRGCLGPERVVSNRREGAFGRVDNWARHQIRPEDRPRANLRA